MPASFFAASGNSKAPGTRTTSTFSLAAPERSRASSAAASRRSVIKLLKRLTTIPKRKPEAVSSPWIDRGWSFSAIMAWLSAFELRFPLLQESFCAFAHVFGCAGKSEEGRLQEQAFFLRRLDAALDRFHRVLHRNRRIGNDFLRHGFRRRQKLPWLVDVIDQADALCLFRGN